MLRKVRDLLNYSENSATGSKKMAPRKRTIIPVHECSK